MEIRIHIPRPRITLLLLAVTILFASGTLSVSIPSFLRGDAMGGERASTTIANTTHTIERERIKQAVLERREEILRYQLSVLEEEALHTTDDVARERVRSAREALLSILREKKTSEALMLSSLEALWNAEGSTFTLEGITTATRLFWPVSPRRGISARFHDDGYEKRFGFPHLAIDIPTAQGTPIQAPKDGTVLAVTDAGMGYSSITLSHGDGFETIYGHISKALVKPGDTLQAGDEFALSGGLPGSPGAGQFTTGPHLHFAVRYRGALIDPLPLLPAL